MEELTPKLELEDECEHTVPIYIEDNQDSHTGDHAPRLFRQKIYQTTLAANDHHNCRSGRVQLRPWGM